MSRRKKRKDEGPSLKPPEPVSSPTVRSPFLVRRLLVIGLMAVITLAAYANTFRVPFHFDDATNIVSNTSIRFKTLSVEWFDQLIKLNSDSIRFFSYFTFALNHHFGGLHVFGYHLVNFLVHLSSGLLLYWFLILTFNLPSLKERYGSIVFPIALFSSLIFLVHPIQTQSVTYIVQRMASMAGMFYLLAMVLYIKGRLSSGQKRLLFWAGAALSYLLGLFTKENVAILPLFVALYELYFFQNFDLGPRGTKALLSSIGMVLLIGLLMFLILGKNYVGVIIEGYQIRDFTLTERVLTQFRVVLYYLTLLAYPDPSRLNLDYDFPTSHGLLDPPTTLLSILIVVGLIGYSIVVARKRPLLSYFTFWYFGNLVIESSIFPLEMVYEHRLYLPAIGPVVLFVVLVVRGWEKIKERLRKDELRTLTTDTDTANESSEFGVRRSERPTEGRPIDAQAHDSAAIKRLTDYPLGGILLGVAVFSLVCGSYERNKVWRDTITLWQDCVKKSPKKHRPHFNLGQCYYVAGHYKEAIASYQTSIRLKPKDEFAYNSLGLAYTAIGAFPEAVAAFENALRIKPASAPALANLGYVYSEMNRYPEAIELFKKVVQLTPKDPEALNNLGVAYRKMGRLTDAIGVYRSALRINPDFSDAHNNIGLVYVDMNQYPEAVESFKKALQLKPDDAQAVNNLGVVYRKMGRMEEAMKAYRDALRIKPEFPDAYNNLGLSLYGLRRYPEAVKAFQEAIRLKPKEGEFHYNLGVTQTALGDNSAALQSYQEAVRINPGHVKARFNLGLTYLTLKNHDLALEQSRALKGLDPERAQRLLTLLNSNR